MAVTGRSEGARGAARATGPGAVASGGSLPRPRVGLPRRRVYAGLALVVVGLPLVTVVLVATRGDLARESALLIYMLCVVVVAVVGGLLPGLLAAGVSFLLANWYLTPPYNTFRVRDRSALIDLVVFLLGAVVVSVAVEVGARHRARAERDQLESRLVSRISTDESAGGTVGDVLGQVSTLFGMTSVRLLDDKGAVVAAVGPVPQGDPALMVGAGQGLRLEAYGARVFAEDRRLLAVLAATAGRIHERDRLAREAARAAELEQGDRMRSALLAAVSHDLRTPIAGIKAAASGLRQPGADWQEGEEAELLATIEADADKLADLVDNLLDMSRLQAGALSVRLAPVALDEVVSRALVSVGGRGVRVEVPEDAYGWGDAGLLERVVANLIDNGRRWSPPGTDVLVALASPAYGSALQVVDHGPGVERARWDEMFQPFQRLADSTPGGVGLGLAIARGFMEAMGGSLVPSQTPGGGLTMTVSLPERT